MSPMPTETTASPEETAPAASIRDTDRRLRLERQVETLPELERWSRRNRFHHAEQARLVALHVDDGNSVLHVGCGLGDLLSTLAPADGTGIDLAPALVERAHERHDAFRFEVADPESFELDRTFDRVVVSTALADLTDIQACLECVRRVCRPDTRVVLCYYNALWGPILRLATSLGLRRPTGEQNWLGPEDFENLLRLADFDIVTQHAETLVPVRVPVVNFLANRLLAKFWPFRHLCLTRLVVARPQARPKGAEEMTVTVVIPTRNERGNIEAAVQRLPEIGRRTEIIFVDGHSTDGTPDEVGRVIDAYPDRDIRFMEQDGRGKGDAVRKAFAAATGDVLMILDADLTVPPEDLPRFLRPIVEGTGEFINGTRLVYPMEDDAMRFLNKGGNRFFSLLFTWLLGQRFRDTLCGTKVLTKRNYDTIAANRSFFGDFDPFGDFDLIFGAARGDLKIVEVPVRYRARTYGSTNISRFRHGLLLLRMSWVAFKRLKMR
ncbi:MAG: glycosyltransferase [Planctomycetes bacterium]|nr:glycosyltransferase [Planctomycetota bacterium]